MAAKTSSDLVGTSVDITAGKGKWEIQVKLRHCLIHQVFFTLLELHLTDGGILRKICAHGALIKSRKLVVVSC
jgi:hypothetical protein